MKPFLDFFLTKLKLIPLLFVIKLRRYCSNRHLLGVVKGRKANEVIPQITIISFIRANIKKTNSAPEVKIPETAITQSRHKREIIRPQYIFENICFPRRLVGLHSKCFKLVCP